ncbi:MAG TPA: cupredoxin domain-containing protein [Methylomirabilota bacterium]|nr:cupredoxin domain-containing protein [Methylomirabilota bacterium]
MQAITITARNVKFAPGSTTAAAGIEVALTLANQDVGVLHDLVVFDTSGALVARTEVISGPSMASTSFLPAAAGRYAFKCSVHPQTMIGTITVQ